MLNLRHFFKKLLLNFLSPNQLKPRRTQKISQHRRIKNGSLSGGGERCAVMSFDKRERGEWPYLSKDKAQMKETAKRKGCNEVSVLIYGRLHTPNPSSFDGNWEISAVGFYSFVSCSGSHWWCFFPYLVLFYFWKNKMWFFFWLK